MPLVTLTLRKGHPPAYKRAVLDAVQRGLVTAGVPAADRFQRVLGLAADDFVFDPRYPDLASDRADDFVLIEILWSVGRSVKVKRALLAEIVSLLRVDPGIDPEHVMVVFKETQWENRAFGGGRLLHI